MKDTWFSLGFIVFSSWPYYKWGSKWVAWSSKELALEFLHTCSRPAQDRQRNSEKHLEAERIDVQINLESEIRNSKISLGSDYPNTQGRINTFKKLDYPILSSSFTQRACFQGLKISYGVGLSDAIKLRVGQRVGWCTREHVLSDGKYSSGPDDPTWTSSVRRINHQWHWSVNVALEFKLSV